MTPRPARITALTAIAVLGLAACGDDGNDTGAVPVESPSETTSGATDDVGSIVDVAADAGSFTTLVAAIEAAGLADTLSTDGPFTVFAPTDEAFAAALDSLGLTADELLADTETLTSILTYHVVEGEVPSEIVVTLDGQSAQTLNGSTVAIALDGETVTVDDATVTAVDIQADNGIVHVIDTVLLPPSS